MASPEAAGLDGLDNEYVYYLAPGPIQIALKVRVQNLLQSIVL